MAAIAVKADDDVWVVGSERHAQIVKPIVEHWNGAKWSLVNDLGSASQLVAVFVDSHGVWALGRSNTNAPFAERWNGLVWKSPPLPSAVTSMSGEFTAINVHYYSDDNWIVGWYVAPGSSDVTLPLAVHLNDNTHEWVIADTAAVSYADVLTGVFVGDDHLAMAVGYQTNSGIDGFGPAATYPYSLNLFCRKIR
jgi:hypothetical protein